MLIAMNQPCGCIVAGLDEARAPLLAVRACTHEKEETRDD